jgi:hypothetical protein
MSLSLFSGKQAEKVGNLGIWWFLPWTKERKNKKEAIF